MHGLIRRAAMAAGAAVVLLGPAAGVASASGKPDPGHIYWALGGAPDVGTISEANLDGTNPHTLITVSQENPVGIAVGGSHIYWTNFGGTINEANLDGTNPRTLVTISQSNPQGIAVGP